MTQIAKRVLTLFMFLGILFASVPSRCVQALTERQPTEQQVRTYLLDKMQAALKMRSRGFTGWQSVQTNRKGNTLYAYVQGGKVVGFAIGRPNMVTNLRRLAPNGPRVGQTGDTSSGAMENPKARGTKGTRGETPVITGGGVKEQQKDGDGPTEEECAAKLVRCMLDTSAIDFLRGLSMVKNLFTLDLDGLVENYEDKEASTNKCLGETCKKILGIE